MATEAPPPEVAQPAPEPAADAKPPVKRSWRRKYRKMRIRFDNAMQQSSALIMEEWKAMGVARRLQAENDQLLDALLDFNNQPRVPPRQRFDLAGASAASAAGAASADPAHPPAPQPATLGLSSAASADQHAPPAAHAAAPPALPRSLASLEATVPHTAVAAVAALPDGIDLSEHAPGYMSTQHEEDYLLALDQLLDDPAFEPATSHHRTFHLGPSQPPLSEKDLTIRNPDSVYNWLRKNQPQVFLQDKDAPHHDNASEKAAPKGASKKSRPSNVGGGGGTPGPKDDHDGEDSAAPEGKAKGKKSAADPDDTAYRPKGGSSRPAKRKRDAGEGEAKGARKKNRPSTAAAPPQAG
ncbi:IEC3 subunit of the Ino80 complex, chromatin re-modelling-domain-containing protein [Boeremia exigua]|uniref:IEC3 subunit of the Ino80 complex, chromatin re-modelling-domain-containing protein n=1 Tax=Boeremia exigua TaxID=749465 RepID=UPI001E8DA073|nr:IEC3 subunit of the Ino80 complex, chromatin re-modelling-domain-containing protein [Boeremia exigua]KAH6633041.1 IEC3 subunit of the Ino80 complex, chromatin re-modelling-domain-containing protein [Boeremia exigua]